MTEPSEQNQTDATRAIPTSGAFPGPPQPSPGPGPAGPPPGWAPVAATQGFQPQGPQPQGPVPAGPPPGWAPTGYAPQPPSFVERVGIENVLAAASIFFGVVTYFMGAVSWLVIPETVDRQLQNWTEEQGSGVAIPAFLSYEMVLNPGWFFLLLGTVGVAASITLMPRWRHLLPFLAFGATAGWLGLFAGVLVLPPFVELGVGAILALIFGFIQVTLLVAATILSGRAQN
ncbi:DUF5336 domain-containing protein [Gordonia sp. CPCC 205333]|uniref:DUF5336 domain-containing protein n=1 Tax=Gordonia sp. CPCC 205333 TaxID=3140790 RepID=UPI003AF3F4AA